MRYRLSRIWVAAGLVGVTGCASNTGNEQSRFVGEWEYDKVSLREHALASAIESVSAGEPESLSDQERDEVRTWVYEQHEGWNKSVRIHADKTYEFESSTGDSSPEITRGSWQWSKSGIVLSDDAGQRLATAELVGGSLVLKLVDEGEAAAEMVMNPAGN